MKPAHLLLLLLFNVFWAATLSANKALEPWLAPGGVVTLRFGLAGLGLLALWPWLPGKAPRGGDFAKAAVMGSITFVLGHRLQVYGTQAGSAGNASVLMAAEPVLTAVAASIFLREHVPLRRWVGFSLGVLGVLLLGGIWRTDFQWLSLTTSFIFVSSFLCEAAYSIIGKPLIERAGILKVMTVALVSGLVVNLAIDGPATVTAARTLPPAQWLVVAYLAIICTMIGYALWFVVIRETDVNVAVMTILVQPIAGVPIAVIWLGEELHWGMLWGSLATVTGLVIGLARNGAAAAGRVEPH